MDIKDICVTECSLIQRLLEHQKMLLNFIYVLIIAVIASNLGEKILSVILNSIGGGSVK